MASGIFAILDDIAALMDDVAVASKIATKKTAGILGDDLAVNAEKATGFLASREIPVLWKITKGSFLNKVIIVPIAILLNIYLPLVIKVILLIGGCYLAYEGMEKIVHYLLHSKKNKDIQSELIDKDDEELEKAKVKSALLTDFILSVEIVIIALGTVLSEPLSVQILTVSVVAIIATIGVYGIVALIVRMDDTGYKIMKKNKSGSVPYKFGRGLVRGLPVVIKSLSIIGTIALILVSGGIFAHNVDALHHFMEGTPSIIKEFTLGLIVGLIMVAIISLGKKLYQTIKG